MGGEVVVEDGGAFFWSKVRFWCSRWGDVRAGLVDLLGYLVVEDGAFPVYCSLLCQASCWSAFLL